MFVYPVLQSSGAQRFFGHLLKQVSVHKQAYIYTIIQGSRYKSSAFMKQEWLIQLL